MYQALFSPSFHKKPMHGTRWYDKTCSVCFCSTRWQLHVTLQKTCSVLVGILPFTLWYFNSLVVDYLLTGCFLISSGCSHIVFGVTLWLYFLFFDIFASFHEGFASGSCRFFVSSFLFIHCFCSLLMVYI